MCKNMKPERRNVINEQAVAIYNLAMSDKVPEHGSFEEALAYAKNLPAKYTDLMWKRSNELKDNLKTS